MNPNTFPIHDCLTIIVVYNRERKDYINAAIKRTGQPGIRAYCIGDRIEGLKINLALLDSAFLCRPAPAPASDYEWLRRLQTIAEQVIYL